MKLNLIKASGNPQSLRTVATVVARMKKERMVAAMKVGRGLRVAGTFIQRTSQKEVPVDEGNLKGSAFTRVDGVGFDTKVTVGYEAAYAVFVHENVEMKLKGQPRAKPSKGRYWDPQGRGKSKFLEDPVKANRPEILRLVQTGGMDK